MINKGMILGVFCAAMIALTGCGSKAKTETETAEPLRIWGAVSVESEQTLMVNNENDKFSVGDIILNLSEETKILDADSGMPLSVEQLKDGEKVYAYISEAMTASLPPQTAARVVLANIQDGVKVPDYIEVKSMEKKDSEYQLTSVDGLVFRVPADCPITPYLTRNMLYLEDIYEGARCLVWTDDGEQATRIMMFPPYGPEDGAEETNSES